VSSGGDDDVNKKVFVMGLPWKATEDDVRQAFESAGTITAVELPLRDDGKASGNAYVHFSTAEEATAALDLDGSTVG